VKRPAFAGFRNLPWTHGCAHRNRLPESPASAYPSRTYTNFLSSHSGSYESTRAPLLEFFGMPVKYFALFLLTATLCGCRYDGAFMQMDSNSPFPFLGFQLAVDSGVRPSRPVGEEAPDAAAVNLRIDPAQETTTRGPRLMPPPGSSSRLIEHLPVSLLRMPVSLLRMPVSLPHTEQHTR
jgi:hypothetical protein